MELVFLGIVAIIWNVVTWIKYGKPYPVFSGPEDEEGYISTEEYLQRIRNRKL